MYISYRAKKRAKSYMELLKDIKTSMANIDETRNYAQRAFLMHDNWMKKEFEGMFVLFHFSAFCDLRHFKILLTLMLSLPTFPTCTQSKSRWSMESY